jgi:hypothetical protein
MVIYERMQGEPAKAWQAFTIYRDASAARAYRSVAESLGKSVSLIERWGSRWHWQQRVMEYDRVQEIAARAEMARASKDMKQRHINEGLLLQQKGIERLQALDTDRMSVRDSILCVREGAKLERLSRGEPTAITETHIEAVGDGTMRRKAFAIHRIKEYFEKYPTIPRERIVEKVAEKYRVRISELADLIQIQESDTVQ